MTVIIIVLSICLTLCLIGILIYCYHQLLSINEINKRLLLLTQNSMDNERNSLDRLMAEIESSQREANNLSDSLEKTGFNPHDYFKEEEDQDPIDL